MDMPDGKIRGNKLLTGEDGPLCCLLLGQGPAQALWNIISRGSRWSCGFNSCWDSRCAGNLGTKGLLNLLPMRAAWIHWKEIAWLSMSFNSVFKAKVWNEAEPENFSHLLQEVPQVTCVKYIPICFVYTCSFIHIHLHYLDSGSVNIYFAIFFSLQGNDFWQKSITVCVNCQNEGLITFCPVWVVEHFFC